MLQRTSDVVLCHRWGAAAHVELVAQGSNFVLVVLLDLELILLELIDFVTDEFHLLNLLCDLVLVLLGTPILVVELCAQGVKDFIQAVVGLARRRRTQIWVTTMLRGIEHVGRYKMSDNKSCAEVQRVM
jgi:hypothetical protein